MVIMTLDDLNGYDLLLNNHHGLTWDNHWTYYNDYNKHN